MMGQSSTGSAATPQQQSFATSQSMMPMASQSSEVPPKVAGRTSPLAVVSLQRDGDGVNDSGMLSPNQMLAQRHQHMQSIQTPTPQSQSITIMNA